MYLASSIGIAMDENVLVRRPAARVRFRDRLRNAEIRESFPRKKATNAGQLSLGVE